MLLNFLKISGYSKVILGESQSEKRASAKEHRIQKWKKRLFPKVIAEFQDLPVTRAAENCTSLMKKSQILISENVFHDHGLKDSTDLKIQLIQNPYTQKPARKCL